MDLLSYFRVLRRRWLVVLICVVVGAGLGVASTLSDSGGGTASKSAKYYKATHTLLMNPSGSSSGDSYPSLFTNLDQIVVLTTTGPVPDAAAKKLATSDAGPQLAEHITTLTNSTSNTLAITAVSPDESEATSLADTFADQLVANLGATDLARYNKEKQDATDKLNGYQAKIDDLNGQIGAKPTPLNIDVLQAQLTAIEQQYTQAFSNLQAISSQDPPVNPLTTLQGAQAIPIDVSEYRSRLTQGELGQNNLQAGSGAAVAAASSSSSPSLEGPLPRGILGGFLGLLAGVGIALLLEHLDRRLRSRADAEAAFRLPVLAEVPELTAKQQRSHEVVSQTQPFSRVTEAYRGVRSSLLFQRLAANNGAGARVTNDDDQDPLFDGDPREPLVVMVTSASPREGKTTSSANLAAVFAEAGSSVLVVNCDFRRPMIHQYFDIPDEPRRVHRTNMPGVRVVTNVVTDPNANPARVVAAQRELVNTARGKFDVVILDTAPLLSANDAIELVSEVDFVVLTARCNVSAVPAAERAMESLDRVDAPVAGVILLGSVDAQNDYYTYYVQVPIDGGKGRRGRSQPGAASTNGHAPQSPEPAQPGPEEIESPIL